MLGPCCFLHANVKGNATRQHANTWQRRASILKLIPSLAAWLAGFLRIPYRLAYHESTNSRIHERSIDDGAPDDSYLHIHAVRASHIVAPGARPLINIRDLRY